MTQDFTSVVLFYVALRDFLMATVGLTIERTIVTRDIILTNGAGAFVRLRSVAVSPTVSAVGITLGSDPDVLAVSTDDPELCLPFNTTAPDRITVTMVWEASRGVVQLLLAPNALDPYTAIQPLRCYRSEFGIVAQSIWVSHEDPPSQQYAPNFKVSGGPYLQIGV